jgi:hypothetical protein
MAEEAGRDPQVLVGDVGRPPEDLDLLKRNSDLGIARMNVRLPPAKTDQILPLLDHWAMLIRQLGA